ncbi:hypothetical protein [Gibbsiella quercinecans]|uniref:hypothetical protein n=1 Tax=Gibbsiella quercinecans TaxID=929813 RepID=UPI0014049678|nr:hypothetical protein [Gibbsiella quercinecans]
MNGWDQLSINALNVYHARSKISIGATGFERQGLVRSPYKLTQSFPVAVLSALAYGIE